MKSKVERAAELLDSEMRVYITRFRVGMQVRSSDIRAVDAVASVAGEDAVRGYPGVTALWRCSRQSAILQLLTKCIPFMTEQKELAVATVVYLESDDANSMFAAMLDIFALRRMGRRSWDTW